MSTTQTTTRPELDLGRAIGAPFKDKRWLGKCAVMGLMLLIPIVGSFNLSGWMKAIADRRIAGGDDADTLPEASLDYIGAGWRLFLAYLPLFALAFLALGFACGAAGVAVSFGGHGASEDIVVIIIAAFYLGIIGISLASLVVGPAITFLHVVEGEAWASVQFKRIWGVMRQGGVQYLLLLVAGFVAGLIAQMGVLACYLGLFVTVPLAQAIMGAAIAEYARVVKPQPPTFPLDGGTGGVSGDPFGIKL